jgi:SAM-dependent methyltransferase
LLKQVIENGKFTYRRTRRKVIMNRRSSSTCMKEIRTCQMVILNSVPTSNRHCKSYQRLEPFFWCNIPEWIAKDTADKKIRRTLDIGCGYGTLSLYMQRLLNCDVYTIDFVDGYGNIPSLFAKVKSDWFFEVNNIERDTFPWDQKFDIIIFTEVMEHLNFHPLPTLRKIHNLLSDDGLLYLSTPDASEWGRRTKYYSSLDMIPLPAKNLPVVDDHVYVYTKTELLHVLDEAGFAVKRFGYSPGEFSRHFNLTLTKK